MPPRGVADAQPGPTAAQLTALRAQLLRYAITLPAVAIGDSRLYPTPQGSSSGSRSTMAPLS